MRAIVLTLAIAVVFFSSQVAPLHANTLSEGSLAAYGDTALTPENADGWGDSVRFFGYGSDDYARCDTNPWRMTAGAVFLQRSRPRSATLVEDGTTGQELVNTADFDLGVGVGPRVELARRIGSAWEIEFTFFSVEDWSASRSLEDDGNLRMPMVSDDPDDFFDTASATYTSRLYSNEWNLKRRCFDRLALLAGFRWVEVHEQCSAEAHSNDLDGTLHGTANNHMYGFQLGLDAAVWDSGRLRFDGFAKAGVYGTHMRVGVVGEGTNFDLNESLTHRRTSFLAEIGLKAHYRLTRHCSLFGGYEVMWIDGLGLAANTAGAMEQDDANVMWNGSAFYHGAMAGLEINF